MSTNHEINFTFLSLGMDTSIICYYLDTRKSLIDFEQMAASRDGMDRNKDKDGQKILLGGREFLLKCGGTLSGYPFMIRDEDFIIEFGEFNNPSFSVKFLSKSLWRKGLRPMHQEFLDWAASLDLIPTKTETISRLDVCLDYHIANKDFDENSIVSTFHVDSKYRSFREDETYNYGTGTRLRFYNKSVEIKNKSGKTWFYTIWGGVIDDVWRIEWQLINDYLKKRGIRSLDDLEKSIGFSLVLLCEHHTSLRTITSDTNRSRWPVHPLWTDAKERLSILGQQPIKALPKLQADYPARVQHIVASLMGYMKSIAALSSVYDNTPPQSFQHTLANFCQQLHGIHDPLSWQVDVQKRMDKLRLHDV